MSSDQFWLDDPWLVVAYRRASELRNQRLSEEEWLQGAYIFHAVSTAIYNAFKKKGAKAKNYMEEPIRIIPLTEEEEKEKAEKERERVIEYFNRWQKRFKGKGENI